MCVKLLCLFSFTWKTYQKGRNNLTYLEDRGMVNCEEFPEYNNTWSLGWLIQWGPLVEIVEFVECWEVTVICWWLRLCACVFLFFFSAVFKTKLFFQCGDGIQNIGGYQVEHGNSIWKTKNATWEGTKVKYVSHIGELTSIPKKIR